MDADSEKGRCGTVPTKTKVYVQSREHYNAAMLREIVAEVGMTGTYLTPPIGSPSTKFRGPGTLDRGASIPERKRHVVTSTSQRAEILTLQPSLALASWQRVVLAIWRGLPTVPAAEEAGRHYRRMTGTCPEGFAVVIIVEEQVDLPDEPTRRAVTAAQESVGSAIVAMACVQEGSGFRGTVLRTVLHAVNAMTSAPYPRKLVSTVPEATTWVSARLSHGANKQTRATELRDVISAFRATIANRDTMSEVSSQ
jgi:hypothetical protein